MKKSLKLLILATAIVAMSCSILKTNAEDKRVSVHINDGQNMCYRDNYDFSGYDVKATAQDLSGITHTLSCSLLASAQKYITITMPSTISNWNSTIDGDNFTIETTAWDTTNGTLDDDAAENAANFTAGRTIYDKLVNTAWELTWVDVTIDGVIPAGTPAWFYTWTLILSF